MEPTIKIYVVCHKKSYVPKNPYLYPIQVGASIAETRLPDMLHDDVGDNISEKNKSYCELTAQYWAWKNDDADYYGFFHYRRYFAFDPDLNRDDGWGNIAYERISQDAIKEMKLIPSVMKQIITQYDMITVKGRKYPRIMEGGKPLDVYHEYGRASFQHRKDLDITLDVLREKYPEFADAAEEYMKSNVAHECNMFIMKKEIFHKYCEWLFDILFEAEKRLDMTWYSVEEYRVMGYLAERLCGIYYTYLSKKKSLKCFELPKTLFHDTAPNEQLKPIFEDGVPIVLSANDKFAPYLDVMIQSIISNASPTRQYDIIVLFTDISEKNQNLIIWSARDKSNISIRFIRVCEYFDFSKLFVDQHLSVETYYRLIIPEIMPDYHKILYLDCDMVANHDVAELYDIDLQGCIVGATRDIDVIGQVKLKENNWGDYIEKDLKLSTFYDYFQAGVLILDLDKLRKEVSSKKMLQIAVSNSWRCHDQDILNMICKNQVYYIPLQWNVLMIWEEPWKNRMQFIKMIPRTLYEEYMAARKNPYMVHFAGYQKPWNVMDCDLAEYFWEYARLSIYYSKIVIECKTTLLKSLSLSAKLYRNPKMRKLCNKVFPYKSKRRAVIKNILKVGI